MRIRTIKPEFWRSEDIAAVPFEYRLLFIGLWSYVDDNGVGLDDFRAISADLFALEDDPTATRNYVRDGLAMLSRVLRQGQTTPLITRYEVDGKAYLYITGWSRHQRVDRPNRARYPEPPAGLDAPTSGDDPDGTEQVDEGALFATPSRGHRDIPSTGTGEQGNRGTGEQGNNTVDADASTRPTESDRAAAPPAPARTTSARKPRAGKVNYPAAFEAFWNACPRKEGKLAAFREFERACRRGPFRDGEPAEVTLTARMAAWAEHWARTGKDPEFIPHPRTWLHQGRYEDRPPTALVPRQPNRLANGGLGEGTTAERVAAAQSLKRGTRPTTTTEGRQLG